MARVKNGLLTCMGDFDGVTGQRRAEPHALWLVVGVHEVDHFSFVRHAALGNIEAQITDSALICEQSLVARLRPQLHQTCEFLDLAFKLNFDFICWVDGVDRAPCAYLLRYFCLLVERYRLGVLQLIFSKTFLFAQGRLLIDWDRDYDRNLRRAVAWCVCERGSLLWGLVGDHRLERLSALDFGWVWRLHIFVGVVNVHNSIDNCRIRVEGEGRGFADCRREKDVSLSDSSVWECLKLLLSFLRFGLSLISPTVWKLELLAWAPRSCELGSLRQSTG